MGDESLELEPRKKIYRVIEDNPGLHLREIDRKLDIPLGTIRYHVRVLEKNDMIVSRKEDKYKRFYATGEVDHADKKKLEVLRKELPRTIILFLLEYPDSKHGEISESLAVADSTLSYYLKKLRKKDMIERRDGKYRVKEEDQIANLLIQYKQTFLDSLVDRFVRIWTKEG